MKEQRLFLVAAIVALGLTACMSAPGITLPAPVPTLVATPSIRPTVSSPFQIQVISVTAGQTVLVTMTVRSTGPQSLLFDNPILDNELPTPESLEQARFEMLNMSTGGHAQITLEFPRPDSNPPWMLVFNPHHTAENYAAPRVEIAVEP